MATQLKHDQAADIGAAVNEVIKEPNLKLVPDAKLAKSVSFVHWGVGEEPVRVYTLTDQGIKYLGRHMALTKENVDALDHPLHYTVREMSFADYWRQS